MTFIQNIINIKIFFFMLFSGIIALSLYFFKINRGPIGPQNFFGGTMLDFKIPEEKIKKVVLDNGMTILIFRNDSVPKVLVQIAYDIGSYVEDQGERGLAHLIEHMIFKGTNKMSESDIDSIARKYGATLNAYTSNDITSYFFEVDKNNWKPFIGILSDCMQNARFDEQHLASELKVVIQELKMYKDNYWRNMFERASELLFQTNHPYHRPVIGYKEELTNLSAQNLKKFYKKHYSPDHATLFIVGDVDVDDAISVARQNFEQIPKQKREVDYIEKYFPKLTPNISTSKTIIYEDIKKEQLGFYWRIPGLRENVEVVNDVVEVVLGEGHGSRLHKRLIDEERIASSVSVFGYQLMQDGIFLILVEPINDNVDECRKIVIEEIDRLIRDGITDRELQKVVKSKRRHFFQEMQSLHGFTNEWIHSYIAHRDEYALFKKINEFNKIDSNQVQKFVAEYLDPFLMNQIGILPIPKDKKILWEENKKRSDDIDKQILSKYSRTSNVEDSKLAKKMPPPNHLEFSFPRPTEVLKLSNGLDVIVYKDSYWPIFTVRCQFKDAEILSESKDGIALGLMMNMLIEGGKNFSKQEIVEFFESYGASASFNESGARLSGLSEDVDVLLAKFFEVLTDPDFTSEALQKLKTIFIDSFQRAKDAPDAVGLKLMKNEIYKNLPIDWTFDEAIEILKKITVNDLKDLHKKYLSPQNMILSVVGSFDIRRIKDDLLNVFSRWSGEKLDIVEWGKSNFEPNKKIKHKMLRDQSFLYFGRPSQLTIYDDDLIPIKILNLICFSSLGSRLSKIRERTGMFYNAFGGFAASATKEPGFDFVGAILSPDKLVEAEREITNMIDNVSKNGITQDELDAAVQQYLKLLIDLTSSNEALAAMFARIKSYELGFDYYDNVLNRIQNMSLSELNKIAKKYFIFEDFCSVTVGRSS